MTFNFGKITASVAALFFSSGLVFLSGCCDECESKCESCSGGSSVSTTVESTSAPMVSSDTAPAPMAEQPVSTSYDRQTTYDRSTGAVQYTTDTAGGAVQSAGNTASGTVQGASNTAGNAVQGATNTAGNAVDSAVQAPGKVLRGLGL